MEEKKYERLLGIGEKHDFLIELLSDVEKNEIISFFKENHFKEIRNTFFHSAYSLEDDMYMLHDSEPIVINGVGVFNFDINQFLYPKVEKVIAVFDKFKALYFDHFNSYKEDKTVAGLFPNSITATILGSQEGLKGFRIKNAVQFYGEWHDSGIWYDEKNKFWAGHNINMYFNNIVSIELIDQLKRYEGKDDIRKNDSEFHNMIDKIGERKLSHELSRATKLLLKFGDIRRMKTEQETFAPKKASFAKITLPYYRKAREIGSKFFKDLKAFEKEIKALEKLASSDK